MPTHARKSGRPLVAVLLLLFIVLPLFIVQLIPTDSPEPHVFKAVIGDELGRSTNDQLVYFSAEGLEGSYPARDMAVALDRAYTRGASPEDFVPGDAAWFQGGLMTPEVFYGEQYLFFGKPEVYVRQVKSGILWPDQVTELRILYLSPLTTLAAPVQLPFFVRSEEMTGLVLAVLLARLALVIVLAVVIIRRARRKEDVLAPVLVFAVVAVLLTVLILGNLY